MDSSDMDITVNGERHNLDGPLTVRELLDNLQVVAEGGVAVLLNGEVARRKDWAEIALRPRDEVEIVRATVGG